MEKCLGFLLLFLTCVRSEDYYEGTPSPPPDNNIEEVFLGQFLDEIKPFIAPIVQEWKRNGSPENMQASFFGLVEKYAQHSASASPSLSSDAIESFLRHVEEFKSCVDRTLARAADDPALREMQPIFPDLGDENSQKEKLSMFRALGDVKSRYSKIFSPSSTTAADAPEWFKLAA